ncbi:G-box-binding factor-like [Sergentomyia squamirostris]
MNCVEDNISLVNLAPREPAEKGSVVVVGNDGDDSRVENLPGLLDSVNYLAEINETTTEAFIVYPGPEDVSIQRPSEGIYQQSVTLTARMWPPVEAGPQRTVWGLPAIVWGVVIGCTIVGVLVLATLFFCCWLLPRSRKFLSPSRCGAAVTSTSADAGGSIIMAHNQQSWTGVPPQYSAPAPPLAHSTSGGKEMATSAIAHSSRDYAPSAQFCSLVPPCHQQGQIPDTHKSMWAINPLYASSSVLSESEESYRTRSLPHGPLWGKGAKQRPVSTGVITDDLEELYAKVNFSKKRRNRMRNDEAAIIALCRSRSQNLAVLPMEREGIVVYDERTAL